MTSSIDQTSVHPLLNQAEQKKRITMVGIKVPGKPWVIRIAEKGHLVGCILPGGKTQAGSQR